MKKPQAGFTLVELLIVIVVIAILAAITLVSYNGIQKRATNVARVSAVEQAIKLMHLYKTANGEFPEIPVTDNTSVGATCLGDGWPVSSNGDQVCWDVYDDGSQGDSTFVRQEAVNSALAEFGNLPSYPQKPLWSGRNADDNKPMKLNGFVLYYLDADMTSGGKVFQKAGYSVSYTMPDDAGCGISGAIESNLYSGNPGVIRCAVLIDPK